MTFSFFNPVRLYFGEGEFERLGEEARAIGRRPLIVTGRQAMRRTGWLDKAIELLREQGLEPEVYDQVPPNPTDGSIEKGAELCRQCDCDLVIGLGGGSAMDAAKAIAVRARHNEHISHFVSSGPWGDKRTPGKATLPIICVTSTAGTSSELTRFAVITVEETKTKAAVVGDAIFARVSIADPRITYSAPPRVTAATGIDVFCHALEAYVSNIAQPVTDPLALEAISKVAQWLPKAVENGEDEQARREMLLANVLAGYALSQVGATIIHGLEHPISALHPQVAHGEGLAALLPAYLRMMAEVVPQRLAKVAQSMGIDATDERAAASQLADAVEELLEAVGLRISLTELGVAEDELSIIVESAWDYMRVAMERTPGNVDEDFSLRLLQMSM